MTDVQYLASVANTLTAFARLADPNARKNGLLDLLHTITGEMLRSDGAPLAVSLEVIRETAKYHGISKALDAALKIADATREVLSSPLT